MLTAGRILTLMGLFLGAGAVGLGLSGRFAPGSWLADCVSFFAFPLAFAFALQTWYGLALFGMAMRLVRRPAASARRETGRTPLAGSIVFLPVSSTAGALAGLAVGLLSTSHSTWLVLLTYWLTGTLHGVIAWRAARAGLLTPSDSA